MKQSPAHSEGARAERKAMRARLRRRIKRQDGQISQDWKRATLAALNEELDWVLSRQKRYDARKGGL